MHSRRSSVDLPLVLFGLSSLWASSVAYDAAVAERRLAWIGSGLLLYLLISRLPVHIEWRGRQAPVLASIAVATSTALAAWFLLAHDWATPVDKAGWLDPGQHWLSRHLVHLDWPEVHPNVAGGLLACLLPLHLAAAWPRAATGSRAAQAVYGAGLTIAAGALVFSRLRGAWLALALGWLIVVSWPAVVGPAGPRRRSVVAATAALIIAAASVAVMGYGGPLPRPDRWSIWTNGWYLAWDYPLTGIGLGGFPMAYSSYALLLHVPHTMHAHNLFLDTWLELGLPGLLALLWVSWRVLGPATSDVEEPWGTATRVSWTTTVLLGLVDDVHFGYGGAGALLLFVPLAIRAASERPKELEPAAAAGRRWMHWAAFTLVIVAAAASLPRARAALITNRAALAQTRAELGVYRWPEWPIQDAVRRSTAVDLAPIVSEYQHALALAPSDANANMRLGQIELSLGDYDAARRHLSAAYAVSPRRDAIRQMFGECLAVTGEVDRAAGVWRTLALDVDQLALREAWYRLVDEPRRADWVRAAAARAADR